MTCTIVKSVSLLHTRSECMEHDQKQATERPQLNSPRCDVTQQKAEQIVADRC